MTQRQVDNRNHFLFATEIINELNSFYALPVKLPLFEGKKYFNNDIRWGIVTISYVFRRDYIKVFLAIEKVLRDDKSFQRCCMLFPVKKNERYFFNYLKRISLIYEMTAYCYKKGNNFFTTARNCIAKYEDKNFFATAGSWPGLNKTASILTVLGRPLLLVILEEISANTPLDFPVAVERIEKRLKDQNNTQILNSKEMRFLIRLKEKMIAREQSQRIVSQEQGNVAESVDKNISSHVKEETTIRSQSSISEEATLDNQNGVSMEKSAILEYFRSFLSPEVLHELSKGDSIFESIKDEYIFPKSVDSSERKFTQQLDNESTVSSEYDHASEKPTSSFQRNFDKNIHFRSTPNLDEYGEEVKGKHYNDKSEAFLTSNEENVCSSSSSICEERNETSDWKLLEEDLFLSDSSMDEDSRVSSKGYRSPSVEHEIYISDESVISESQSLTKYSTSSEDETSHLKMLKNDLYNQASFYDVIDFPVSDSSDVESVQRFNIGNKHSEETYSQIMENAIYSSLESTITDDDIFENKSPEVSDSMSDLNESNSSKAVLNVDNVDLSSLNISDNRKTESTFSKSIEPIIPTATEKSENSEIDSNIKKDSQASRHKPQKRNRKRRCKRKK